MTRKSILLLSVLAVVLGVMTLPSCSFSKKKITITEVSDSTSTEVIHPYWLQNAVLYETNIAQATKEGTINAFADQLGRIRQLGVNVIVLTPINPITEAQCSNGAGCQYACNSFMQVAPALGTVYDFTQMVKRAHENGLMVIMSWQAHHTSASHHWLQDHPDWYAKSDSTANACKYANTLNYSNSKMRDAMTEAMLYWVQSCDVDGFNCSLAEFVPVDYWQEVRQKMDAVKSVAMFAESNNAEELCKKAFDATYTYTINDMLDEIAYGVGENHLTNGRQMQKRTLSDLAVYSDSLVAKYPADTYFINALTDYNLSVRKGSERQRYGKCLKPFTILQYTLPGLPMLYFGQEIANERVLSLFSRDPITSWVSSVENAKIQTVNRFRYNHTCLSAGAAGAKTVYYPTDNPNVLVFSRQNDDAILYVFVNATPNTVTLKYKDKEPFERSRVTDVFNGTVQLEMPKTIAPWSYRLLTTLNLHNNYTN